MSLAFLFPGQGSQTPGSGTAWTDDPAWGLVAEASDATGVDVAALLLSADADELLDTAHAQLSTFVISLVAATAATQSGLVADHTAGHSLGEYTALVAAGVLDVADGARLVHRRGLAMRQAAEENPGTMAAIIGLDTAAVADAIRAIPDVWVANDNAPGQVVIAGSAAGIEAAGDAARAAGARRPMPLAVAGAFHTPFMSPAQAELDDAVAATTFRPGTATVWANVDASPHAEPDAWPALLSGQLCSPVRWREEIAAMAAAGVDTFVECGPGTVLGGMVKRIVPDATRRSVSRPADL